jgi:hypothetical protein
MNRSPGGMNAVRMYLPDGLDPNALPLPRQHIAYAAKFISDVFLRPLFDKDYGPGAAVPMYSKVTERLMPRGKAKAIVAAIVAAGAVVTDGRYRARGGAGASRKYALAETYRRRSHRLWTFCEPELAAKLRRHREQQRAGFTAVHTYLEARLRELQVVADAPVGESVALDMIARGEPYCTLCAMGRLHTAFTGLRRDLRGYTRVRGRPLVGLDISNSQPVLLGLTVQAEGGRTGEFLADSLAGCLCERLMTEAGCADRDEMKKKLMLLLYGCREDMDFMKHPAAAAFRVLYPDFYCELWRRKPSRADPGYAAKIAELPCKMQRLESELMIGRVCRRLMADAPDAALLTVHDMLATTEDRVGQYRDAILGQYRMRFGVEPALKVKPCTPDPKKRAA